MITLSLVKNSAGAAKYYAKEDIYKKNRHKGASADKA